MIALGTSQAAWFLTRGTGIVSLLLLTSVTILGVLNAVRWSPSGQPRFVLQRIHRNLSLLAVAFILVHIATAVIDSFAPIRLLDAIIPFGSRYRPIWLGLGAVAFDLIIAVVVTSLLRARIGYLAWRIVHWTAYVLWPVAVFHSIGTGSDVKRWWMLALLVLCTGSVLCAMVWRIAVDDWSGREPGRIGLGIGAVVMPLALGAWVVLGPLQPGWAARAGTPKSLLPKKATSASIAISTPSAPAPIILPATTSGTGTTVLHHLSNGDARVVINLRTTDARQMSIQVTLDGQAAGEGISMTGGSAVLTPPQGAAPYQGSVTGLDGGHVTAQISDGHGDEIGLDLFLSIAAGGRTTAQIAIRTITRAA
jgi:ferric reductase like protein